MINIAKDRFNKLINDDSGAVLAITIAMFLILFLMVASTYAVGMRIQERIELQNACDAAAYSAASVQADGLSRMATVNKAMAWTYIQMTKRQMDYITYKWLELSLKRYNEDLDSVKDWANNSANYIFMDGDFKSTYSIVVSYCANFVPPAMPVPPEDCCDSHKDGIWWCGNSKNDKGTYITLNDKTYEISDLSSAIDDLSGFEDTITDAIDLDMKNILTMNDMYPLIQYRMIAPTVGNLSEENINSIPKTIYNILSKNLAKNQNSGNAREDQSNYSFDSSVLDDYYFYYNVPFSASPYDESATSSLSNYSGNFLPLMNTEAHERIFLQMADPDTAADKTTHPELFALSQFATAGLDQWFIRGDEGTHEGEYDHGVRNENIKGLKRVYKSANENESNCLISRSNYTGGHSFSSSYFKNYSKLRSVTIDNMPLIDAMKTAETAIITLIRAASPIDIDPTSSNSNLGDLCKSINNSVALYSEYEWGAGRYYCTNSYEVIYIPPTATTPPENLVMSNGDTHTLVPKWWDGIVDAGDSKISPYSTSSTSSHGYISGPSVTSNASSHYTNLPAKLAYGAYSRVDYKSCEIMPTERSDVPVGGFARIYGDDEDIFNDNRSYYNTVYKDPDSGAETSVIAKPWILSKNFFEGGDYGVGSGSIVVGVAKKQKNLFSKFLDVVFSESGLFSAFNPTKDSYMWAVSAARAVYKHPKDGKYYTSFEDPTEALYDKSGECVCGVSYDDIWNLCQTDWVGALLPVRNAFRGQSGGAWNEDGGNAFEYMYDVNQDNENSWLSLSNPEDKIDYETIMATPLSDTESSLLDSTSETFFGNKIN